MSDKLSQIERVKRQLINQGFCSRNYYLDLPFNKITRLSSIIEKLRKQGYDITTDMDSDPRDTLYRMKPLRVERYYIIHSPTEKELVTKPIWK